jgi:hypothetical protein
LVAAQLDMAEIKTVLATEKIGRAIFDFAEAQIDLDRIRKARHYGLLRALNGQAIERRSIIDLFLREQMRQLEILDRYERRALSCRKFAARAFKKMPAAL